MTNRLINETSPYLQQHAHNPVDWYPWGQEALQRAREEDKPILLSIGYSSCHWCHVMERESFEDPEIARLMNERFVSVKVDREERPDLDGIYMTAVQALTGHGGWPLTVFITPDGKPFFGGTYFPPEDRHGMPGFPRLLQEIANLYGNRRGDVTRAAEELVSRLQQATAATHSMEPLTADTLTQAYHALAPLFDEQRGGFGTAPKFPQPMVYEFLLRYQHRFQDPQALHMVEVTLEQMARGGMYDQLGGGFHRYSTDGHWLVPHFEKMLYDNALLSRLYLHAYQITGKPLYRRVVEETLGYVLREMTDSSGGFYSAQDADSEGEEGKYFVWSPGEIQEVLGVEKGTFLSRYFGVTEQGNLEGKNILHLPETPESVAENAGLSVERLQATVGQGRERLLAVREGRVHPDLDDKVLTAWNGLMLRSFAEAAEVLQQERYRNAAVANASFLLEHLRQKGRLLRSYKDGVAKGTGFLEDYANLIDGLLTLHEATFDPRWLEEGRALADAMIDLFWVEGEGVFYDTGHDHEELLLRPRDVFDNALPCGGSAATDVLLRLGVLTGESEYTRRGASALRPMQTLISRYPMGGAHWLSALDFYLSAPKEIAIVGRPDDPATVALRHEVFKGYLPNRVMVGADPKAPSRLAIPLLESKGVLQGHPTAYVCEHYACQEPVTDPEALARQLRGS